MDAIPLSALNHFLYCERRAFLIHGEGQFVDNEHTVLGHLAHAAVDTPGYEQRAGWELLRALPLFSDRLALSGKADLVEARRDTTEAIIAARPVEYKKGPKRRFDNDEVQLCAQALCLEEMFGVSVPDGGDLSRRVVASRYRDVRRRVAGENPGGLVPAPLAAANGGPSSGRAETAVRRLLASWNLSPRSQRAPALRAFLAPNLRLKRAAPWPKRCKTPSTC